MSHEVLALQERNWRTAMLAFRLQRNRRKTQRENELLESQRIAQLTTQISEQVAQIIPEGQTEVKGKRIPVDSVLDWCDRGFGRNDNKSRLGFENPIATLGVSKSQEDIEIAVGVYAEDTSASTPESPFYIRTEQYTLNIDGGSSPSLTSSQEEMTYSHPSSAGLLYRPWLGSKNEPASSKDLQAFSRFFQDALNSPTGSLPQISTSGVE